MAKLTPQILIFDLDGVLVDVRNSYHRTIIATVLHFTGRRVSRNEVHRWKMLPGYNNDWKLAHEWVRSLGGRASYREVKRVFQEIHLGKNFDGYIRGERRMFTRAAMRRLAQRSEMALFTGRLREETMHTLERFAIHSLFQRIITLDDVRKPKPDPEGLRQILDGRNPASALYLGDSIDDALAARDARVPFIGVLSRDGAARRTRSAHLKRVGAKAVLGGVEELEGWLR